MEQNLRQGAELISQARLCGARMVCLPEGADYVVDDPGHAVSLATPLHGNGILARYASLAAHADIWLSLGGIHELSSDGLHVHKTHVLLAPHAGTTTPYAIARRIHADIGGDGITASHGARTDEMFASGDALTIARGTPVGNVGLISGHDARFPAVGEALAAGGADVLVMATNMPAGLRQVILRARAVDTQCYVAAAGRVSGFAHGGLQVNGGGVDENDGQAMIVGPDGKVVVVGDGGQMGGGVVWGEIQAETLQMVRAGTPLRKQRRDDLLGRIMAVDKLSGSLGM